MGEGGGEEKEEKEERIERERGGRGGGGGERRVSVLDGKMVAFTNLITVINCPALSTCAVEFSHHLHTIVSLVEPGGFYYVSYWVLSFVKY